MEFWEVVEARHSSRNFSREPVPREKIEKLLHAASTAPSAMNSQPWHFHVTEGEARQELGKLVSQATLHLVDYVEQPGEWDYDEALLWYSSLGHAPVAIGVSMPSSEAELDRTNNLLAVGAAIENLLLAATAEGLEACNITFAWWVRDELAKLLGIGEDREVVAIIAVGLPGDMPPAAPPHDENVADWLG